VHFFAAVSIEGEYVRKVTSVAVGETKSSDRGIGGQAMTAQAVKAIATSKS
jgi:hypothetical protein